MEGQRDILFSLNGIWPFFVLHKTFFVFNLSCPWGDKLPKVFPSSSFFFCFIFVSIPLFCFIYSTRDYREHEHVDWQSICCRTTTAFLILYEEHTLRLIRLCYIKLMITKNICNWITNSGENNLGQHHQNGREKGFILLLLQNKRLISTFSGPLRQFHKQTKQNIKKKGKQKPDQLTTCWQNSSVSLSSKTSVNREQVANKLWWIKFSFCFHLLR